MASTSDRHNDYNNMFEMFDSMKRIERTLNQTSRSFETFIKSSPFQVEVTSEQNSTEDSNINSNLFSLTNSINELKSTADRHNEDFNEFVKSSPFHVIVDEIDKKVIKDIASEFSKVAQPSKSTGTSSGPMANLTHSDRLFLKDSVKSLNLKDLASSVDDVNDSIQNIDDDVGSIKRDTSSIRTTSGSSGLGGVLKAVGTALLSLLGKTVDTMTERVTSDIKDMIDARNDIMYQYGISDPHKADELYKLRFQHKALPFQHRTAPEQRQFQRQQRESAINMGFNTQQSVSAVTKELVKWQDIFEDIDFKSSEMFKTTMRFIDKSGESFNAIMNNIREVSTNYIVTPDLLEEVSSGYARYMRTITNNNNAYVRSMNSMIGTVGKLEDAGVESKSFLEEVTNFQYADVSNASSQNMWKRLAVLGEDPYEAMTMSPDKLLDKYTSGLKNYFKDYDLSNGQDRLMVNTIAQQVFGYSTSEMQNLYDLLESKPSDGASGQEKTIDDYTQKIALDAEQYYDTATAGWTYLTESQKFQDALTLKILNNDGLINAYERWDDLTKGMLDINDVVGTLTSFITGGALIRGLSSLFGGFGGTESGLLGKIFGTSEGATALSGYGLLGGALIAAGVAWGIYDGVQGVKKSEEWLGKERGNTTSGKVSSFFGGFLGGTGPGWMDEDASTKDKAINTAKNAGKYGLVGAGIGTLIAPGVGTAVGAGIGAGVGALLSIPGGEEIANAIKDAWDYTKEWGIQAWDEIQPHVEETWKDFKVLASTSWKDTTKWASDTWNDSKDLAGKVWDFFTGEGETSWDDVKSSANTWWEDMTSNASTWWSDFKENGIPVWNDIKETADTTMGEVFEFFGADWDQFKQDVSDGWEDIKKWGIDAFNTVIGSADLAGEKVFGEERWKDIKGWINDAFSGIQTFFTETLPEAWDGFVRNVTQWWNDLTEWYEDSWLKDVVDWTGDRVSDAGEFVADTASNAWDATTSWASDRWDDITSFFGAGKERGEEITGLKGHASGLDYVPYDNYGARLHKGERILTVNQNAQYSKSLQNDYQLEDLSKDYKSVQESSDQELSSDISDVKNTIESTSTVSDKLLTKEISNLDTYYSKGTKLFNETYTKYVSFITSQNKSIKDAISSFATSNDKNLKDISELLSGSRGLVKIASDNESHNSKIIELLSDLFQKDKKTGGYLWNLAGLTDIGTEDEGTGGGSYNPFSSYSITSKYGNRKVNGKKEFHGGVDYNIPANTNLQALDAGIILYSGSNKQYGNYIDLQGNSGYTYRYAHLNQRTAKQGDTVKRGDILGTSGSTGTSTGPHLHLEIMDQNGSLMNPSKYFKSNAVPVQTTNSATSNNMTQSVIGGSSGEDMANGFPYYRQGDPRWGGEHYGSHGTIASSGCGPTSMAMVLKSYGVNVTPSDTAKWSASHGFRASNGTSWGFFSSIGNSNGLSTTEFAGIDKAKEYLNSKIPVIGSMRPGDFTKGDHFIVFTGLDGDTLYVNDPATRDRTDRTWNANSALSQAKQFWAISKNGQGSIGNVQGGSSGGGIFDQILQRLGLSTGLNTNVQIGASEEENAKAVYSVMKSVGIPDVNISGTLGNFSVESGVDPTTIEGIYSEKYNINGERHQKALADLSSYTTGTLFPMYAGRVSINKNAYHASDGKYYPGIGLGQWTGGGAMNFINESPGGQWWNPSYQLQYLVDKNPPTGSSYFGGALRNWTKAESSPEDAASTFARYWEGNTSLAQSDRRNHAKSWYDKMQGWNIDTSVLALSGNNSSGTMSFAQQLAALFSGRGLGNTNNTSGSPGATGKREEVINYVRSKLGSPYSWGSAGPNSFDCSGLVSAALNEVGLGSGGHFLTTSSMSDRTPISSVDQLTPGDFLIGNHGKHTGVYVGNGKVIHASGPGGKYNKVVESDWNSGWFAKWNGPSNAYFSGGKITQPTLSLMGEGGFDEYVVTTDPQFASRSRELISNAANDLGLDTAKLSTSTPSDPIIDVNVDVKSIVDAVEALSDIVREGFNYIRKSNSDPDKSVPQQVAPTSNVITNYA